MRTPDRARDVATARADVGTWFTLFVPMLVVWLLFSGYGDLFHVGGGVLSAALVATLTVRLERRTDCLGPRPGPAPGELFGLSRTWLRFLLYAPWLLVQMLRSAVEVAVILVHPRLPIDPVLERVPVRLRGPLPVTAYAQSITLTPGTVTVDLDDESLEVHALTRHGLALLRQGAMEARLARAFGQAP